MSHPSSFVSVAFLSLPLLLMKDEGGGEDDGGGRKGGDAGGDRQKTETFPERHLPSSHHVQLPVASSGHGTLSLYMSTLAVLVSL